MSKISEYAEATTLTNVKLLGNQAGVTKQIPATLFEPVDTVKYYVARLEQTGTSAPTATVFQNGIGTNTLSHQSTGVYRISNTTITRAKTYCMTGEIGLIETNIRTVSVNVQDGYIELTTYKGADASDEIMGNGLYIEIRVYP